MKKLFSVCAIIGLLAGCAPSTKLTWVYKAEDYNPAGYKKLAVIAIVPKDQTRIEIEDAMVAQLKAQGINAVSTWNTFQFANHPEMLKKAGFEGEKRKEVIRQKVAENHMDAILTVTLFDAKEEQRYVPGTTTAVGIGVGGPVYGYPYAAYMGYAWEVTSTPGYYENSSTYLLETNLYDIASEKLAWTGQTRTDMNYSAQKEIWDFSKIVVTRLVADSKPRKK
jgi:hypothetical protein